MTSMWRKPVVLVTITIVLLMGATQLSAQTDGLETYKFLSGVAANGDTDLIRQLNTAPRGFDWTEAETLEFKGNLRMLESSKAVKDSPADEANLFFIRNLDGTIYLLSRPAGEDPLYADLGGLMEDKLEFQIEVVSGSVGGDAYEFARFLERPSQAPMDRIFKTAIIVMLFFVMVGMGLTLTLKDFALVFKKPKAVLLGELLQFGIMPLVAVGLGYLMGFRQHYPFIYVGMILIAVTPGGVTSNLMTHYAKGDVALSVSLTSISTVLAIVFVPLLLGAYGSNIPEVVIPFGTIVLTIVVLVLIPLVVGMLVRAKFEKFAKRSVRFFSILGVIALLFLIVSGIISNLQMFADTERYGFRFYSMILILTLLGMFVGALVPKLFRTNNYQTRAISLETGLRNSSLAMAIALLIQDAMGDFYSSLFFVSGIFGLAMYVAGLIAIKLYPIALPVKDTAEEAAPTEGE